MTQSEGVATTQPERLSLTAQGEYVTQQFICCSDQRMKTFNYYAILVAAATTASVAAYERCPWPLLFCVGAGHVVMATIFFMIDIRNTRLVHSAREAMRHFEAMACLPPEMQVFTKDEAAGEEAGGATDPEAAASNKTPGDRKPKSRYHEDHPFRHCFERCFGAASYTRAYTAAIVLQVICGIALIVAAFALKRPPQP